MVCEPNFRLIELLDVKPDSGGALVFPLPPLAFNFCKYVKDQLKIKDHDIGLAMLNYCSSFVSSYLENVWR